MLFFSDDVDDVFLRIAKRTVYSYNELQNIISKRTLVILFRFIALYREISNQFIEKIGVKSPIQTIRRISEEQYLKIKNEGKNNNNIDSSATY